MHSLRSRLRRPLLVLASVGISATVLFVDTPAPVVEQAVATPAPTLAPPPVFVPEEVEIPRIEMTAPTVPVGTRQDGSMDTPKNAVDIAWWSGVKAGEGNTLLAAHRDWSGQLGSFYRLSELEVGDEIVVRGEGEQSTYVVEWSKQMDADVEASEILGPQGEPVVTLITCGGVFDRSIRHYTDRVVVRGVLAA